MAEVDKINKWSKSKLRLLGEYLAAYSNILNTQRPSDAKPNGWLRSIHYIDAFAGSVTPYDKVMQEYIDGSPRVALKCSPPFDGYIFIDKNRKRLVENVDPLKSEFSYLNVEWKCGDCNDVLIKDILPRFGGAFGERGFIFLDPYGLELKWNTVEAIGRMKIFDVFINFSVMGIYRQLRDRPPTDIERIKIDEVMGGRSWFSNAYIESRQLMLFDTDEVRYDRQSDGLVHRLCDCYRKQLQTCFGHVSRAVIMRGPTGSPLYALILASQHARAVSKMHEIYDRHIRRKKIEIYE